MYKKVIAILIFAFLIVGAVNAADFKINEGFEQVNEYYSINENTHTILHTWDYNDELMQESYLQNDTDYSIVLGDNNTYNTTYHGSSVIGDVLSYVSSGNIDVEYGVLEIAEIDGNKYVFMVSKEKGTSDDWKYCYDELMKFNENNNIEPIADAI